MQDLFHLTDLRAELSAWLFFCFPQVTRSALIDLARLAGMLARERKAQLRPHLIQQQTSQILADRRGMFESVAGPAPHQPYVFKVRMAVNQEVAIPGIFVLANTSSKNRRIFQAGNLVGEEFTQTRKGSGAHHALVTVGINRAAVPVESDFETAAFYVRNSIGNIGMKVV